MKKSLLVSLTTALLCSTLPTWAQQPAQDFPDGPGKQTVLSVCGGCHEVIRVRAGYTPEGWRTVIRMHQNVAAPVPQDQWGNLTEYLTKNFPEKPRPIAAKVAGPADVAIRMWTVPTPGSRPHDPMAAKDGSIWWSGQLANKLGRLDPKTNQMAEFDLKSPRTGPHGLVEDKEGNIWYTGNTSGMMASLNQSGGRTEVRFSIQRSQIPTRSHSIKAASSGSRRKLPTDRAARSEDR
jgi:virginiamycin B lyase